MKWNKYGKLGGQTIFYSIVMILLASCGVLFEIGRYPKLTPQSVWSPCLEEHTKAFKNEPKGPIHLIMRFDSFQRGQTVVPINGEIGELSVEGESDLLQLNDALAIKFFQVQAQMYGKNQHLLRYDIYTFEKDCWRIQFNSEFKRIGYYPKFLDEPPSGNYLSSGMETDSNYFKLYFFLYRR